ncbi:MAG: patatin-like phospholipase family protein [Deltaproteobacteria bacterium]|nr:patatin-like phospholipase family protein [Deltaproteobacteria bacterium]
MKKSISLVLGSGGARGYAHIGIIEVLEDYGYEIKSIAGSSMGALIGGLYACGKLDVYREWVLTLDVLDVLKLLDFTIGKIGFIKGDRVFSIMEEMIGENNIEDLPISFTAVATNLTTQKEVWLQKGSLSVAVRASIALPTIFTPVEIKNKILIDGGILNPVPIGPTLSDMTDLTVAVNLNSPKTIKHQIIMPEKEKKRQRLLHDKINTFLEQKLPGKEKPGLNYTTIFRKTIDAMQHAITRHKMAGYQTDVVIEIPGNCCDFYDFHKAYEMIEIGKKMAAEALERLDDATLHPNNR